MGVFSNIGRRYQAIRRYNQIMRVLLKYGFEDLVQYMQEQKRFSFIRRLIPKRTRRRAALLTKWERMRMVCEELGPTFVKFGQILSNRPDLIPLELIFEFEKLQDNVPPMPERAAKYVVENELGDSVEHLFAWFETSPFASASMAQVHKATLHSGEKVAIKIQRPEIHEMIVEDIKVMYKVANIILRRVPSMSSFDPVGLVKNFEESIMKEMDFINESINVQRFLNHLNGDEEDQFAAAPRVFNKYTTSKVLTLEFISGTKINNVKELEKKQIDPKIIAERLAKSYFKQIFNYGFFHADPHPGNLIVLPNAHICYLDFGMMGSILQKDIEIFGHLFLSISDKNVKRIIRTLQSMSPNVTIKDMRALEFDINEFLEKYYVRSFQENEMSTLMLELKDVIVEHGLKVPTHFYLFVRSLVTVEGVIRTLDPELDQFELVKPYLVKSVARKFSPLGIGKKVANTFFEIGNYMEDFPADLRNAISKIKKGEIKVDLKHQGVDPLVHTIHRISKQIASAMIISALIIGSSLFVIHKVGPKWDETSAAGIIGFIIAGIIAMGMLRDYRKGDHDDWKGWKK